MKKILLIIIMFICITKVSAKTYYSEYGDYIDNKDELLEKSDVIDVLEEKNYALYKENISYEYLENSSYEKTGKTMLKQTNWVNNIKMIDINKPYEKLYQYTYPISKKFKYLVFESTSEKEINMEKLLLYNKVKNKTYYEASNVYLNNFQKFTVSLDNDFNFSEITLELSIRSLVSQEPFYTTMNIYACDNVDEYYKGVLLKPIIGDYKKASYNVYSFIGYDGLYQDKPLETKVSLNERKSNLGVEEILYRNVYTLNEYKIINKEYTGEYAKDSTNDFLIDKNLLKINYKYRKRDKVVISDNLVVDSIDKKLTDFIIESTIPLKNISITSNINYKVNGEYKINFILPFKMITLNIIVNIRDNYINMINNQQENIKKLEEKLKESNYLINKKNIEIKDVIIKEENKTIELVNSLNKCKKDNKEIKNQKENLYEEKKIKEQSISYIYILIMFILLLVVYRIKYIKKNS